MKKQIDSALNFLHSLIKLCSSCLRYLKSMSPILFSPLSQRISQPSSQDHQNGKWILYRFPPSSFRINKDTSSCICIDALGLYLSPDYLLHFLSNLYWLKFSNLLCSIYWEIHLRVKKLNLAIFDHPTGKK